MNFLECDTIMLLVIALLSSIPLVISELCSTCVRSDSACYNVTYLFDIQAPFREHIVIHKLAILRSTNTLYYSFEPNISDEEYYKVGFINLDDPVNSTIISGGKYIMNFGTFDVDQENGLVYLGGSDGIYVLDTKSYKVAPYSSRGDSVLSLFYKGHVYFVRYGEYRIVKKKGDNFDVIVEHMPVKNFVVNKDYVIVFVSMYGLFATKNDETVWLSKNSYFRGLAINLDDEIYVWWLDGIYKITIDKKLADSRVDKVIELEDIDALTFDNDNNFLFTSGRSLYKLLDVNMTLCDDGTSNTKNKTRW
ncbi:ommochrome-binding protein-like [Zerene cesonia]|uniref:ommochrome-binding protein-like n=1 Tax=Zerene cesonia TaxID=33412 RepID=UPI0018E4EE68|nr:ommochrome-binding protein-like [Zerene cesonia]